MKRVVTILTNFLEKSYIWIPRLMIFFTLMAAFVRIIQGSMPGNFGLMSPDILATWKAFRNVFFLYYFLSLPLYGLKFLFVEKLDAKTARRSLFIWLCGLLLMIFSYATVGILIDLGYLIFFMGVGGKV